MSAGVVAASLLFTQGDSSALAKGGPDGSKTNKRFEACLSTCVFDATKACAHWLRGRKTRSY
jgi:hypothetical protein